MFWQVASKHHLTLLNYGQDVWSEAKIRSAAFSSNILYQGKPFEHNFVQLTKCCIAIYEKAWPGILIHDSVRRLCLLKHQIESGSKKSQAILFPRFVILCFQVFCVSFGNSNSEPRAKNSSLLLLGVFITEASAETLRQAFRWLQHSSYTLLLLLPPQGMMGILGKGYGNAKENVI